MRPVRAAPFPVVLPGFQDPEGRPVLDVTSPLFCRDRLRRFLCGRRIARYRGRLFRHGRRLFGRRRRWFLRWWWRVFRCGGLFCVGRRGRLFYHRRLLRRRWRGLARSGRRRRVRDARCLARAGRRRGRRPRRSFVRGRGRLFARGCRCTIGRRRCGVGRSRAAGRASRDPYGIARPGGCGARSRQTLAHAPKHGVLPVRPEQRLDLVVHLL